MKMFEHAFRDWSEMFGFEANALAAQVRRLEFSEAMLKRIVGKGVFVGTKAEGKSINSAGDVSSSIIFVFPNEFVGAAITAAMMIPPSDLPTADPENQVHIETTQELMNLFCGSATASLEKTKKRLRISQSVDDLNIKISEVVNDESLEDTGIICVSVNVQAGEIPGKAWCLIPDSLAPAF